MISEAFENSRGESIAFLNTGLCNTLATGECSAPEVFTDEGPHLRTLHVVPATGVGVHFSTQASAAVRLPFVPVGEVEPLPVSPPLSWRRNTRHHTHYFVSGGQGVRGYQNIV